MGLYSQYNNRLNLMTKVFGVIIVTCIFSTALMLNRTSEDKSSSVLSPSEKKKDLFNVSEKLLVSRKDLEIECRQYAYKDGVDEVDLKEYLEDCIQDILDQENRKALPSEGSSKIYRT